jgi:hypothetical protein
VTSSAAGLTPDVTAHRPADLAHVIEGGVPRVADGPVREDGVRDGGSRIDQSAG